MGGGAPVNTLAGMLVAAYLIYAAKTGTLAILVSIIMEPAFPKTADNADNKIIDFAAAKIEQEARK